MANDDKKNPPNSRQEQLEERPSLAERGSVPGGRSGGQLARNIGTRDEQKRAFERPSSTTRVRKSDDDQDG